MNKQIIHESEAQRQHTRVQVPAGFIIGGTHYSAEDLSAGGARIIGIDAGSYKKGDRIPAKMVLPFKHFTIQIDTPLEVEHSNSSKATIGCRFTDLSTSTVSIVSYVIRAFMTGHIVSEEDILQIVSRDNFVKNRLHKDTEPQALSETPLRVIISTIAFTALVLALTAFLGWNVYLDLFTVSAQGGIVRVQSDKIIDFTDQEAPLQGEFIIPSSEVRALQDGGLANIEIHGIVQKLKGHISDIKADPSNIRDSIVKVEFDQPLPEGVDGKPAFARFYKDITIWQVRQKSSP